MGNRHIKFTITVFYSPRNFYYTALPADVSSMYIYANVSYVMDAYIGNFWRLNRKMMLSDAAAQVVPFSDDDAMSGNVEK